MLIGNNNQARGCPKKITRQPKEDIAPLEECYRRAETLCEGEDLEDTKDWIRHIHATKASGRNRSYSNNNTVRSLDTLMKSIRTFYDANNKRNKGYPSPNLLRAVQCCSPDFVIPNSIMTNINHCNLQHVSQLPEHHNLARVVKENTRVMEEVKRELKRRRESPSQINAELELRALVKRFKQDLEVLEEELNQDKGKNEDNAEPHA